MQKFIQEEAVLVYSEKLEQSYGGGCDVLLDNSDIIAIYGTHTDNPELFQFNDDDLKLIKRLVEYVKNEVDGKHAKGANKRLQQFRGRNKKKCQNICVNEVSKENKAPQTISENEARFDTAETEPLFADLKLQLYRRIQFYLESYEVDESLSASFNFDMVKVFPEPDRIYGSVDCVICKSENADKSGTEHNICKRVYFHDSPKSKFWVTSNFTGHLEKFHHLVSSKGKYSKKRAQATKTTHENALKPKNSLVGVEFIPKVNSAIIFEPSAGSVDSSIEIYEEIEVDVLNKDDGIENQYVSPWSVLENDSFYIQFSQQMAKMFEAVLKNGDALEYVSFEFESELHFVAVAQIDKTGDRLLAAICHQLFYSRIGSESHIKETMQLRADVVNYISQPENFATFQYLLQDYANKIGGQIDDTITEFKNCTLSILSQPGIGDYVTFKAVGEMYRVNILIFQEDTNCYIGNASDQMYEHTIALANRTIDALIDDTVSYDHYDSVCDVNTDLLYKITKFITK